MPKVLEATYQTINAIRWAHKKQIKANRRNAIIAQSGATGASFSGKTMLDGYFAGAIDDGSVLIYDAFGRESNVAGYIKTGKLLEFISNQTIVLETGFLSLYIITDLDTGERSYLFDYNTDEIPANSYYYQYSLFYVNATSKTITQFWRHGIIDYTSTHWAS